MMRRLRDWRWKLAYAVWGPCSWVEEQVEEFRAPLIEGLSERLRFAANLEMLPGFLDKDLPWKLRILRFVVVGPLGWLSEFIFPNWASDERANHPPAATRGTPE